MLPPYVTKRDRTRWGIIQTVTTITPDIYHSSMTSNQNNTVEIPSTIYERVSDRVQKTEFESVDDYVHSVLEEVLYHVESENDVSQIDSSDEQEVKERLRSLGYVNE